MNRAGEVLPHDLLWGMGLSALADDAPAWVVDTLGLGHPVVVRRALAPCGQVAVGVRGTRREQRYATFMAHADIVRQVRPEQLTREVGQRDWPALRALAQVRPLLDALALSWGVSGSAGYELASGHAALHAHSDLDLIIRTPQPFDRLRARALLQALDRSACRIDVQLQVPAGALALREWAGGSRQVLLKGAQGARLVTEPWYRAEVLA